MKRLFTLLIVSILCLAAPATFTGCVTNRTTEAKVYDSFKTTYNIAYNSYAGFTKLVVQGKVSKADEAKADAAWNKFRSVFALAFKASSMNWEAVTPAEVAQLANELNQLILSLL